MSLILAPDDEALVLTTPMFDGVERETVLALLDGAVITTHPKGVFLFSQGDAANRFFMVLAGRVNLFALTEAGDQSIIEVIDAGQSFAEAAIFASRRFPINAEAAPGSRLLEVPAQPFLRKLSDNTRLAAMLLASLARWQRRLFNEIADIKSRSPVQRLGLFMLAQAEPGDANTAEIQLPLTKNQLASRIGITPESLSRALARLRPMVAATRGRGFVIADVAELRRFCGTD